MQITKQAAPAIHDGQIFLLFILRHLSLFFTNLQQYNLSSVDKIINYITENQGENRNQQNINNFL